MRIISRKLLKEFWINNAAAETPLKAWYKTTRDTVWKSFSELRKTFHNADRVRMKSGDEMTVFNIGGNNYRLIAFISYKSETVYTKMVMTHAEYSKDKWKGIL